MEGLDQIIRGCARNDRASQEKLYKQFYAALYCLCRRFFRNEHEAIESVNDGMLKVFSSIVDYRKEKGNFFNWVYTIVRNTALDKLRSQHRSMLTTDHNNGIENLPENANGHNPLIALEGKELYHLLDQLSPATRMVCNLYYIEGYSVRDIATRLEIAEGTVKWQLSEGRKKLRTVLEKQLNQRT